MSAEQEEADLLREGVEALRLGDALAARVRLSQLSNPPWMLLAQASNRLGDADGEMTALKAQLAADFRHLPALLAMGELNARLGQEREASAFFRTAVAQAAVTPAPPQLAALIERARHYVMESGARFQHHLIDRLQDANLLEGSHHVRIRHAVDLLTGKVPLYLQQPTMFYFPGLPQRPFYEREEFDWVEAMEAHIPTMREELRTQLAFGREFRPYIETVANLPAPNNALRDNSDWSAHYFWKAGSVVTSNAESCPATMRALDIPPLPHIAGRSPVALWSILKPGTHIAPHHGLFNTRLICHVPLLAPTNCALRAGAETRAWEDGEMLIFDDSFEHEAWNRSDEIRVILLFPIWRPEITREERAALTYLFETIDSLGSDQAGTDSY